MALYDVDNNDDDYSQNGQPEYDYCHPGTGPDFGSNKSLISMVYSDCDVNKLAYHTCKHKEKIFNNGIMAISTNLNCAFDITCPYAICGKSSHTSYNCEKLQDPGVVWKSHIQICVALQKIKGMAASQGRNVNSLSAHKLSYVNSVDFLPPSSPHDSVTTNRLDKLKGLLVQFIKFANQTNKKLNSLTSKFAGNKEDDDDDNDEDSRSSLNDRTIQDFLRGAQN